MILALVKLVKVACLATVQASPVNTAWQLLSCLMDYVILVPVNAILVQMIRIALNAIAVII